MMSAYHNLSITPPRVLIVSRRTIRKNKFVDFVGEYHLDLVVKYGAVPVIVPRVTGIDKLIESFEPIHGVLLCEGEDIDPSLYQSELNSGQLSVQELDEICRLHASDTSIDKEKDSIELSLTKLCIERNIPYLGICRGSQVLNVACGGTLYQDIDKEVSGKLPEEQRVSHMNYDNYDEHRHVIRVLDHTPLHHWFNDSLTGDEDKNMEILVNSYHHQGVKRLAQRFVPMAFAPDGLVEGYYDPDSYDPDEGKFIMGLQFHPERMRRPDNDEFDYPGCPRVYQEFVKAVIAYKKRLANPVKVTQPMKLVDQEFEKKRKVIFRSVSLAKDIYLAGNGIRPSQEFEFKPKTNFLKSNMVLSQQQPSKLTETEVGATMKNALLQLEERENAGRKLMGKMSVDQLMDLMSFYRSMGEICSEVLESKLITVVNL